MAVEELASAPGGATGAARLARRVSALRGAKRLALAFAAGAGAALSLPPLNLWPALILALALLLWLLDGIAAERGRRSKVLTAFLTGWSFGFGYFVLSLYWIGFAFLVEADIFAALLPLGVAGLPAYLALYWGLAAGAAILVWRPGSLERAIVFALALAAAEWLRGHLLTGFPWNAPGYAAAASDGLAQLAAYIGIPGLTFLTLAWAGAAVVPIEALLAPRRNLLRIGLAGALLLTAPLSWAVGMARIPPDAAPLVDDLHLRIVQANIPQSEKWKAERREEVLQTYLGLSTSADGGGPRFTHLVWPESALPALVDERPDTRGRLAGVLPSGGLLLLGALRRELPAGRSSEDADVFNSVLVLDNGGEVVSRYDKWRLVPFGEFLPWAGILEPLGLRKLVPLPGSFSAGSGPETLHPPSTPAVAPLICYEAIFPTRLVDSDDRPEWLLNVTNDGWFGLSAGPYQHLEQARFRAIEQGLPLVRAANTGISAVIDPYGRTIARLSLGEAGVIDSGLPKRINATIYARYGDAVFFVLIAIGFMLTLAARLSRLRAERANQR